MKLFCIDSNTTLGGHRGLFERLKKNDAPGARHLFIVPDRYTLGVEKEVCERCFPSGSFSVDVESFTRLAIRSLGNSVKDCLSKEGTVLLLHRVIAENNERLNYYKNIRSVGFAREMFAAIASLRSGGITPDQIRQGLSSIEGVTAEKLADIALLYEEYTRALSEKYFDTVTRVERLCERIPELPDIAESHVYVLGFNVYSDLQTSVIKKLIKVCPSVSVSFCRGMGGSNVFCYPSSQRNALVDWCAQEGVPVFYEESLQTLTEPFRTLQRETFGFSTEKKEFSEEEKNCVRVFSAENPYEEVKCACREIRRLTIEEGCRYKDIAVCCNNADYLPVLKTIFARFGIPCFTDEKFSVARSFGARYVFSALRAICSDYALGDVLEFVRSPLSGIPFEKRRTFENHCLKYGISYSRLLTPFPDAGEAEEVRKEVAALLEKVPKSGATTEEFCDYLISVLQSEEMTKLREKCEEEKDTVLLAYSDTEDLIAVAEEIKKLCAGRPSSPADFAEMLSATLEGMSISLLPQYVDCVFIGNTSDSRFSDIKFLFVLGASDGNFPVQTSDPLILSSFDTELMKKGGLVVYPSPIEANLFEKFSVIDLISKPSDRLYVGYSQTGLAGEKTERGEGVSEICDRLGVKERPLASYYDFNEEQRLLYTLSCPENAYYEYVSGKVPQEYAEAVKKYLAQKGYVVEAKEGKEECDPTVGYKKVGDDYIVSVTMLENYFNCPYRHFLSDVLKLREREEGRMRANEKGTLIHAVLEDYFRKNAKELKTASDLPKRMERSIDKVFSSDKYKRFYDDPVSAYEMRQLRAECFRVLEELTENARHSCFTPTFFEVRFDREETLSVTAGGKKFYFKGYVDRADVDGKKLCVVDYKSGNYDPQVDKIYCGEKIQLYVYLKHFTEHGYRPAGVFYLPIRDGYYSKKSSYAMCGQMEDSLETFCRLDDRATEGLKAGRYDSPAVAFAVKDDKGVPVFTDRGGNRLSEREFEKITEYVFKLSEQALSDIQNGDTEKNPIGDACKRCSYRQLCGDVSGRKKPTGVNKTTFYAEEGQNGVE